MKPGLKLLLSTVALNLCLFGMAACSGNDKPELEKVASFDHQVTGVAVAANGRTFVNFPRWTEDAPISVAEVMKDGTVKAYPDEAWNAWRNEMKDQMNPVEHFVCVQSVIADHSGHLWVVDAAAPGNDKIVLGGPKLVRIDLAANQVTETISFNIDEVPQGSYLNDLRITADDKYGFMTDSGRGAIIVVDLQSGKVRRLLEKDPRVQAESGVVPIIDNKELRRADKRAFSVPSDGIALSADGKYLYWQALTGKTLYRIPTTTLLDEKLTEKQVSAQVEKVGVNGIADGLWIDGDNRMYITSPEQNAVLTRNGDAAPSLLVKDDRLRWPDSFAEGPDGKIYVTSSHIQDSQWFKEGAPAALKTELWRID